MACLTSTRTRGPVMSAKCPHGTGANSSPASCSQCLGVQVETIRAVEIVDELDLLGVKRAMQRATDRAKLIKKSTMLSSSKKTRKPARKPEGSQS